MNVIEEYLVKIGADIDRTSFAGAGQAVNQLAGSLHKLGNILKTGAVAAAIAKTTEAVVSNIKAVAQADMEYQKLAKSMWVTKETAKAFSLVTKTMGASPDDIAWIPELRQQFHRLRAEMAAMQTPANADNQLRWIRDVGYDVESLQLKLKMLREWIVYYLIKYLQPYIKEFREFIRWLNKQLGDNMADIARRLAFVLRSVIVMGNSALRLFKAAYGALSRFFDCLPERTQKMVAAFAVAGAAIMAGPFGLFMTAIGGALLLLEDFWYYLDGKKSSKSLAPLWRWLTAKDNPIKNTLSSIERSIENILNRMSELFGTVFSDERQERIKETIRIIAQGVADLSSVLGGIIEKLTGNNLGVVNLFWRNFTRGVSMAIDRVLVLGRVTGKILSAIKKAWDGDYSGALDDVKSAAGDIFGAAKDGMKQISGGLSDTFSTFKGMLFGDTGRYEGGDKKEYAFKKLQRLGFSAAESAGIVGNLLQENSAMNPSLSNSIGATGIAQWLGGRLDALKAFAADRGTAWNDFDTQLEFIAHEMHGAESHAYSKLKGAQSPEAAAYAVRKWYERPGEDEANDAARMAYAREVYDKYAYQLSDGRKPASYATEAAGGNLFAATGAANSYSRAFNFNLGGITINCGPGTSPTEIRTAVAGGITDATQRLSAATGGGPFV